MLTKDHLLVRCRGEEIHPKRINPDDKSLLAVAELLIDYFNESVGEPIGEVLQGVGQLGLTQDSYKGASKTLVEGFVKLLTDRLSFVEDDGTIYEFRTQTCKLASKLRGQGLLEDQGVFEEVLAKSLEMDITTIRNRFFGDLPHCKKILGFETLDASSLLHRYNCSQVQGLLLRARKVVLTLFDLSLAEKRVFFRLLKFHRLLTLVDPGINELMHSKDLVIEISGPLSLFDKSQNYGSRLAWFFPHVLNTKKFKIDAEVEWNHDTFKLALSEDCGIKSHYKKRHSYVPDELHACLESIQKKNPDWIAEPGEQFVHIGRESYCFPDITIRSQESNRVLAHIELFHRWHKHQLKNRLEALAKSPVPELKLGVCKSIASQVEPFLPSPPEFNGIGFWFKEFPTASAISKMLSDTFEITA